MDELRLRGPGRAPRVLVSGVVLDQPMGGVWRHNRELLPRVARAFAAQGGGVTVLAGRGGLTLELGPDVKVVASDVPSRPLLVRAALETRALEAELRAAAARGAPYDLVHVAHLPAPRELSAPSTLLLHDLRSLDLPHTPFSRRLVARRVVGAALSRARAVFTVSRWMAARLAEGWPTVRGKLAVVPNAGDHFTPLAPARAGGPLLHVGHVEPRKNLDVLLRALALDPALPPLVLAGRAVPGERERLAALAAELGVQGRVRFLGPVAEGELPRLYATCSAVVLPSRLEGFGIPVLEARRAGAPLAVSSAGALPEVAGPDAPTFAPDDAPGCARAVREALARGTTPAAEPIVGDGSWEDSARALARGFLAACQTRDDEVSQ